MIKSIIQNLKLEEVIPKDMSIDAYSNYILNLKELLIDENDKVLYELS